MSGEWPGVPKGFTADSQMLRFRAEKVLEAQIAVEQERQSATPSPDPTATMSFALEQKMHEALLAVSTGAIDRARTGAQFVQTAATAIGGLYTGILAVIYVSDTPVPARGFAATLFFALAIGLATAYLAFVTKIPSSPRPTLYGSMPEDIWQRTNFVARYTRNIVLSRGPLLRAAVVSLVFGVLLLPAAVVTLPGGPSTPPETTIEWPTPPPDRPVELAAILYQAQIDEFTKGLGPEKPTGLGWEDALTGFLVLLGVALVVLTAGNQVAADRPDDPLGDVVDMPPTLKA